MENQQLTFVFTVNEANTIVGALGELPFSKVAGVILNMQQQAQPQLAALQQAEQVTEQVAAE